MRQPIDHGSSPLLTFRFVQDWPPIPLSPSNCQTFYPPFKRCTYFLNISSFETTSSKMANSVIIVC